MSDQGNSTSPSPPSGDSTPSTGDSLSPPSNEPPPSSSSSSSSSPPPPPPSSRTYDNTPQSGNKDNEPPPPPPTKTTSGSSNNANSHPPPPPPPQGSHSKSLSPPPHAKNTSPNNSFLSNEKAIIGGAAAGSGLLIILMIVCLICCCAKRRKRKKHEKMQQYYRDHSHANISNDYFTTGGWNTNPPRNSHEMRMPPTTQVSSEYNWSFQPPPPPPVMASSDMGSKNFSGGALHAPQPPPRMSTMGMNQSSFTYDDLASATGGFASANLLGQGGFGYVHKGVLPNGKEVAVKSLKANSGQGEREFQAEVDIISRVHHRHLVSLVGYCIAGAQRMLVYEFVENDTLENRLHGKGMPPMDWPTRLEIALGSAKGFAYLHEDCHPRIIHRDIKASNILLDDKFEAKVADFGLAKLSSDTNTHVSTRIMGTFGYLAPEYASSGKLTEKSDIYSYGVVLLELITGKRPVDIHSEDDSLVDWARPILTSILEGDHSYEDIADPLMEGNYDPQEMLRMIACAAACIRHSARRRPKMSQIVRALEGDASLDDLNEVVKSSPSSSAFGSISGSTDELKKYIKKGGVSSQEFSSGEHVTTSEFTGKSGGMTGEFTSKSGGESRGI